MVSQSDHRKLAFRQLPFVALTQVALTSHHCCIDVAKVASWWSFVLVFSRRKLGQQRLPFHQRPQRFAKFAAPMLHAARVQVAVAARVHATCAAWSRAELTDDVRASFANVAFALQTTLDS
jgi:hypothetical protein